MTSNEDKEIYIYQYFDKKLERRNLSEKDLDKMDKIKTEIDSFQDEYDIYKYIYERRQNSYNIEEDYRLFNIPKDSVITLNKHQHNRNIYYGKKFGIYKNGKSINIKSNKIFKDYYKKDKNGDIIKDKYGNPIKYGKFTQKGMNFANNCANSKIADNVRFIVLHFKSIAIILGIILVVLIHLFAAIYILGMTNAFGHTPFLLCSDDEVVGVKQVQLEDADVEEASTQKYCINAFISIAKSKGWKDNAIIGTASYLLAEGTAMGTFTYEDHYCVKGPSGVLNDKTLDNQKWLDWLHSDATLARYNQVYYAAHTSRYAAIGCGVTQESDVYNYKGGPMEDNGATKLIERAQAAGVPWQDPSFQLSDLVDYLFPEHSKDSDYIDPTTYNGSAEEYCRRVTTFIGMPGWVYTRNDQYMSNHTAHIPEAQKFFSEATGVDIKTLTQQTSGTNLCGNTNTVTSGGNATIADAAVSLASGTTKIPWDMDGQNSPNLNRSELKLYKEQHIEAYPGDGYFASCDRGSATAIRYSGADNDFPAGNPYVQFQYMQNSDKWQYVGDYGSCDLQPGDVIVTKSADNRHIKIYVGNEAVKKRFPDSDADMYAASFHDYFPYVYKDNPGYDKRPYAVFRNVKSDKESGNSNSDKDSKDKK